MKQKMISFLSTCEDEFFNLSKFMYENPEESYKEKKASEKICELLKNHNFNIEKNFLNIPNSFKATKGNSYPKICFLCEYDAVKNFGHITGHNALTTTSCIAGVCLGKVLDYLESGTVTIIGCPGEYLGGTKDVMLKQGAFEDTDCILVAHPDIVTCESKSSSAIIPLSVKFKGEEGLTFLQEKKYTTLDAITLLFSIINSLQKGFPSDVELNSTLSKCGETPLLLPSESEAKFFIRAKNSKSSKIVEDKIREISKYIGSLMDLEVINSYYSVPSEELLSNKTLNRLFSHNLKECGIIHICHDRDIKAGISLGAVSKNIPTIHPYFSIINDQNIKYGTEEFADCTISEEGFEMCKKVGLALAFTGLDIIKSEILLKETKDDLFKHKI